MLRSLSLRWKILLALLAMSLLPLLLVSLLFTQMADRQFHKELLEKADRTSSFLRQATGVMQREIETLLKPLSGNDELINAIHISQLTGDSTGLTILLKKIEDSYSLERIEVQNQNGTLFILTRNSKNIEEETLTEEEKSTAELGAAVDNRLQLIRGTLTLAASIPVEFQGQVIARLSGFRPINDFTALNLGGQITTELAFHNGNKILASSHPALYSLNLNEILNHKLVQSVINETPYALFPFSLQTDQAGFILAIDQTAVLNARSQMKSTLLAALAIVLFLAGAIAFSVSGGIVKPIRQVVSNLQQISEGVGDLTCTLSVSSRDEVGELANCFNNLMTSLREMISGTRTAASNISEATHQIGEHSAELSNESRQQSLALEKSHAEIKEIGSMAEEITNDVSSLVSAVQESTAATHEFGSTSIGISEQMENLFAITNEISSSIHQQSSSNQQIEVNISELSRSAKETSESIRQMDEAAHSIEEGANQTRNLIEQAARQALVGKSAVMDTIRGISGLQMTIEQAHQSIRELGTRSDAIGNIVNVIAEIADQTNLLALNAAIIAAQAGGHGKGFAVVAKEIRNLAERTSISTDEIAGIIENLQEGTRLAASAIEAGSVKAEQEVARSQTAGDALEKLHNSSVASKDQVEQITDLARRQTDESRTITQAVLSITDTLQQIASSIGQQTAGTKRLAGAAEQMTDISARVKNSTNEQKKGSQQIVLAMEQILRTIEKIHDATLQQSARSHDAIAVVAKANQIAENNAACATLFDQIVKTITVQAKILQDDVDAFKV